MNIVEFLEARIAEDEYEAEVCLAQYRRGEGSSSRRWVRQLAECAAKRALIREQEGFVESIEKLSAAIPLEGLNADTGAYWRTSIIRHLAAIYSDHQDYQQEWEA